MTNRKFHRTIVQVEILSEEPIGNYNLESLAHQITLGDWSGASAIVLQEELSGKEAAEALKMQASDPSFFNLTSEGNDLE